MPTIRASAAKPLTPLAALAVFALAGCAQQPQMSDAPRSFGPQIAALAPIPAGSARIVVARDDLYRGLYGTAQVTIGTLPPAALNDGGLIARDGPPGIYAVGVASGAFYPVQANFYSVTVAAGATAWVRILYYVTQGETSVVGSVSQTPRGGSGSLQPDMATTVGNFQIEELPRELRSDLAHPSLAETRR